MYKYYGANDELLLALDNYRSQYCELLINFIKYIIRTLISNSEHLKLKQMVIHVNEMIDFSV